MASYVCSHPAAPGSWAPLRRPCGWIPSSHLQTQGSCLSSPWQGSACGWPGGVGGWLECRGCGVAAASLQAPSCGICQGQIATPEPASLAPWPLSPHYFCVPGLQRHLPPSLPPLQSPASCLPPPHLCREGLRSGGLCFPVFTRRAGGLDADQSCWTLNSRQVPPSWLGFSAKTEWFLRGTG